LSVHRITKLDGTATYKVRWREGTRNRARHFVRKRDADAFDVSVRRERQRRGVEHVVGSDVTLKAFAGEWWTAYAEVHLSARTRANYAVALDLRVMPALGSMRLREIRPAVVESWIAELQRRGDGGPSILRASAVLSAILQRAVVNDLIDSNPVRQVRKPRLRVARQPAPIAPAVVERIRAELEPHDAALVSTLAYAGLRPESEALPLTWGDVGERTISVHATKTGHTRHVRLLEPLADDLRVWRAASGNPVGRSLVFPRPSGKQWTETDWQNWRRRVWRPAALAAGLPADSRPRDLRASFASLLIHEGRNVVEVAGQLGHSPETCLRSYAREFAELDLEQRVSAEQAIRDARMGGS
jgi:site-specific recombinase XerC